ncbi:ras-responsive element-binding protein 1 isoform X3 [Myxocyprinus asiaticus]|uniref:ras-responsive element-binding protein 1 isoform X3 n=1 Tax=Myxocyprinus asiaticus TaxID=70543 RepID=UPI0022225881|nr:ras-responsive element-binding protein 1 isoform X3 [Myxocyprinus asiaticus]
MDMESTSPDKSVSDGVGAVEINGQSQLSKEAVKNQPSTYEPEPVEVNLKRKADSDGMDKQAHMVEEDEGGVRPEEELSSINSMMSTVMNVGQINGVDSDSTKASPKTTSKSTSISRTGRRNQEVKEDHSNFICPLCNKNCMTQHQLTMHIRQHNTDSGGTDHSCSICGKALSSASSLDRHMLVHSGERPYTCVVCGQTFTTNGNMHRHMKIHEKDANGFPTSSPSSINKRRRLSTKRKPSVEDEGEQADEPPNKKEMLMQKAEEPGSVKREEELLHCPICFKTFICKYGLDTHMETHPDTTLRCNICCITFRTHRALLRHNAIVHKQLPTDPTGRPFIQSNPSIPLGFGDLAFIDFSCDKFPQIAQVWCETNLRRCTSKFHRFVCEVCNKAFPLQQSLDLHKSSHKSSADTNTEPQEQSTDAVTDPPKVNSHSMDFKEVNEAVPHDDTTSSDGKNIFMECLGLQHSSLSKPKRSNEEIQQETLDSIRFICVEPPLTNLPQKTSSSLSLSVLDPVSLQSMNKNTALSLLSLQPLHGVVSSGMFVPISGQAAVELADIEQILKIAATVPPQMSLSLLPKDQASPIQVDPKHISSLKPKPLITPRSSMGASTPPPPVMNAQQASSGNISPSLPPQTGQQLRTARQTSASSSSSTSSSPTNWETTQLGSDVIGSMIISYDNATGKLKQEDFDGKDKELRVVSKKTAKTEYPCRFCKEVFSFLGGLQAHMRHHLGASPYQCTICCYAAPDKATLIRHLRTHSGERPYVCRLCHYPFTVKANCERHLRKKHMKNTRKEIEKNIEYVTTSSTLSGLFGGATLDLLDTAGAGNASCRYCGEDLKNYRALQIHLRTHSGCQRKPFECRQCGAAFLAKRNCIHHLLKQHPEVQEREIEEHIKSLLPVGEDATAHANPPTSNGLVNRTVPQNSGSFSGPVDQEQPLDFSSKSKKIIGSDVKLEETASPLLNDCSMEPIDLSMPKDPEKKRTMKGLARSTSLNNQVVKKEQPSPSTETTPGLLATLPISISSLASALSSDLTKPFTRLKPLLPKPSSEMQPLASIAQIISSVSATPMLIETGMDVKNSVSAKDFNTLNDKKGTVIPDSTLKGSPPDNSKRRGKKRLFQEEICDPKSATGSGIDLESSGEFPSVEKMLATTDANKFSPYLQTNQMQPVKEEKEKQSISDEVKEGGEDKPKKSPQNKGKKNAYSNSVQKMTCPYCPRLFPWASSLQRHMLTHTGQKPYPCPQCESFFSTKSNCERHLLRKHGISNRGLQQSGSRPKPKADEGSQGSTGTSESISDTEPPVAEDTMDLSSVDLKKEGNSSSPEHISEQTGQSATEQTDSTRDPHQTQPAEGNLEKIENDDDDTQSNKSLDMNHASKLVDFKLSGGDQHQPKSTETTAQAVDVPDEFPHTCATCKKTFRHAATLSRHQKTHIQDVQSEDGGKKGRRQPTGSKQTTITAPRKEMEQEAKLEDVEKEENISCVESGEEEEKEKDGEEMSDDEEEGGSSEHMALEEESDSAGGKTDKRKKICAVCSKRFWSLQDLTRHMRSHTDIMTQTILSEKGHLNGNEQEKAHFGEKNGRKKVKRVWNKMRVNNDDRFSSLGERPYKCQTCDRTFTLKHSLVRHQRVHQKPTDEKGSDEAEVNEDTDGAKDDTGVLEGKEVRCSPGGESEATDPIQTENESKRTEVLQTEEIEGHKVEKQHANDVDMKLDSAEEPPKEPKLEEAEQEEPQKDKPSTHAASVESQSGSHPEPAEISVHSCIAAQEIAEKPVL